MFALRYIRTPLLSNPHQCVSYSLDTESIKYFYSFGKYIKYYLFNLEEELLIYFSKYFYLLLEEELLIYFWKYFDFFGNKLIFSFVKCMKTFNLLWMQSK